MNNQSKLSAHDIWVKAQKEGLSKDEYKKLLIENGIITLKHPIDTDSNEMWATLLNNALRFLTEEQREGLCFDLYCRLENTESIDKKIKDCQPLALKP